METRKAALGKSYLAEIEEVKRQIDSLKDHSFGFGTSFRDIDEYLRPCAETFLRNKLAKLELKLAEL